MKKLYANLLAFIDTNWHFICIIGLLVWLISYLSSELSVSRSNERELSRRIYESVRQTKPM